MGLGRVRTWLVEDPDADPHLVDFVRNELVTGGSKVSGLGSLLRDQADTYEELVDDYMTGGGLPSAVPGQPTPEADVVVILRTEQKPSREALTAHRAARRHGKPVHVLVAPGIQPGLDADEVHLVDVDPSWDQLQEFRRWSASLPERFGPDFLRHGGA